MNSSLPGSANALMTRRKMISWVIAGQDANDVGGVDTSCMDLRGVVQPLGQKALLETTYERSE